MGRLTQMQIAKLGDGYHSDGTIAGLYLRVRGAAREWRFRRTVSKRRYEISLGNRNVDLQAARRKAAEIRTMTDEEFLELCNRAPESVPQNLTFSEVAEKFCAWKVSRGDWVLGEKNEANYKGRLANHILPVLGRYTIDTITPAKVSQISERLKDKPETLKRSLRIVRMVFDWAKSMGYIKGDNPADPKGALQFLAPKVVKKNANMGALPIDRVPDFIAELFQINSMGSLLFIFSVLTVTRSLTARLAKWEDIDLKEAEWVISFKDLKISDNGSLRVPLSSQVVSLLESLPGEREGYIFASTNGGIFSDAVFSSLIIKLNRRTPAKSRWIDEEQTAATGEEVRATQHGIARSCFRTWAQNDSLGNDARFDPQIAEICLHHKVDDGYGGAYNRNKFWLRRREMMQAWADFCLSRTPKALLDAEHPGPHKGFQPGHKFFGPKSVDN